MNFFNYITGGSFNYGTLRTDVLFAICVVILLGDLKLTPKAVLGRVVEATIIFVAQCALDVVFYQLDLSSYPAPSFVPLGTTLAIYALLQTHLDPVDRASRALTFFALFVLNVSITRTILPAVSWIKALSFGKSIPSWFSYIFMVGMAFYVRRLSLSSFSYFPKPYFLLVAGIDLLAILAGQAFIDLHNSYDIFDTTPTSGSFLVNLSQSITFLNLVVCASFALLVVMAYYMFYALAREHDERAGLLVTKRTEADNASMAKETQQSYDRLREIRHEIKNHDAYLAALIEAGEYDRLQEVFEAQKAERAEVLYSVNCGNRLVDAVVNSKMTVARKKGIQVKPILAIPAELPYSDDDVFCLLSNLLDNAIEGTLASDRPAGPIQIKALPEAGYYVFTVTNPCDPKRVRRSRTGGFLTTKGDSDVHGYGTRVIRGIAEKYQGAARFAVKKEGVFVASAMLSQTAGSFSSDDGGETGATEQQVA